MQKHTPYHLLHKKLTGEINSAESNLLEKLMEVDVDAEYSSLETELGEIWSNAEGYNPNVVFNADAAFAKFQDRIQSEQADQSTEQNNEPVQEQAPEQVKDIKIENEGQPAKVMRMKPTGRLLPLAASFLALVVAGFLILPYLSDNMVTQNAAQAYALADGSTIWLNEGSEITYPESFKKDRTVELTGEAYFKVASAAEPFMVKTEAGDVEAIGTEFTVSSNSENIEVAVVEGRIELTHKGEKQIVTEREKAYNEDGKIEVAKMSSRNIANWRKEGLSFKADNLATVVNDLKIYFGVDIKVANQGVDTQCKAITSPNIGDDSSIEYIFDNILDLSHEIEYTKNADGSFTIDKFNCSK